MGAGPARFPVRALLSCALALVAAGSSRLALGQAAATIETYVGSGNGDGAEAIDATIDPRGLIAVGSGATADLYIADGRNHRVRRVDGRSGLIVTVAGNGTAGFSGDNGPAQDASLSLPLDVARDAAGNLYISEYNNNRVRKVSPSGQISTFAGNGNLGFGGDGGLATQAALYNPWGVAVGPDGLVYIADSGNNRIRRVGPAGCIPSTCVITTVVGSGTWGFGGDGAAAASAVLRNPTDVTFDSAGNMLIADWGNHRVRRVAGGIITTVAGGGSIGSGGNIGDGGSAVSAVLRYPAQIAVDASGILYITDTQQRRLRTVEGGIIRTMAGTGTAGSAGDGGPASSAELFPPYGVAVNASGDIWIATTTDLAASQHNRVRHVDQARTIAAVVGGGLGNGGAAMNALVDPRGATAVSGAGSLPDLYFADGTNHVVRYVSGENAIIYVLAGTGEPGYSGDGGLAVNARLRGPLDVAVDGRTVYVADTSNNVVRRITSAGVISTIAGTGVQGFAGDGGPATQARLTAPTGLALDANGNLYIADYDNHRVRRVGTNGIITTVAGNGSAGYSGDGGPATAASLRNPWDVAVGGDGTLYIADTFNHRIRRVAPSGTISTYAGTGRGGFSGDGGLAIDAGIDTPALLALDRGGKLFIADRNNARVRMILPSKRTIHTVAGNGQTGVAGDGGPPTAASFSAPTGVAVDPSGQALFIASSDDGRVRVAALRGGCAIGPVGKQWDAAALLLVPLLLLFLRRAPASRRHCRVR